MVGGIRASSNSVAPGVRCGSARGTEAKVWPRRRGGRSQREAWGGGFGERERGTSEELLPSLIATYTPLPPTTSIFFGCS